jgi:hypothetical protein
MTTNKANRFIWLIEEQQIRQVCKKQGPGDCGNCPVVVCGMARVPVCQNTWQMPASFLDAELADYIAYLLLTAEGWPAGLDIEGFADRRMWPDHPVMKDVADIIDNS